jgi:sterol desaturase/sphingolipid hydroxylase (fatty acid hydroxylase superfamily)
VTTACRDGALALLALLGYCGVLVATEASLAPAWFLLGALGAVVIEALTLRYRQPVRSLWERQVVQLAAIVGVLGVALLAALAAATALTSLVAGGLVAYLLVLGLVTVGVISPPGRVGRK